ncbi:hypothetical protein [Gordonibacter sp.]|uniref:hypothetical protein n=1 Tax=Gordonibacter sp. TaxID=1968902 RepID=UPI0025C3A33D|nr:hypothetical protein [Gordonibacter sp.]
MRAFILLLKVQLLGLFGVNKALHANPGRAKRTLGLVALAVVGIVALVAAYVGSVATSLVQFGLGDSIPLIAVLAGSLAGAVAAFLKANGVLFGFRDYDLVMSLPVPTAVVVLSRIASLYAMGAAFGLLVMVPAFVVYAGSVGVPAVGVLCMALSVVLAPLAPLAGAVVLAALVAVVSSRFRHANVVMALLSMVLLVGFLGLYFAVIGGSGGDLATLAAMGADKVELLGVVYPPAVWAANAIAQGDVLAFALFAGVNVAAALVLVAVLAQLFVPVNALFMASHAGGTFSFEDGRGRRGRAAAAGARSPFRALLAKEARLLMATPIYFLNGCMGYVLVVVGTAALLVASLTGVLPLNELPAELVPFIGQAVPWALAFFVGIMSTTVAAVSLEGSARWLMLTAPVPARTILAAKAALNLAFAVPAIVVSGVLVAIAFPLDALSLVGVFVVPLALALFSTFMGLALDAQRPRYDWTSPYEPVKRGMPVFVIAFGGVVLVGLGFAVAAIGGTLASLVLAVVVAGVSLAAYRQTVQRGLTN